MGATNVRHGNIHRRFARRLVDSGGCARGTTAGPRRDFCGHVIAERDTVVDELAYADSAVEYGESAAVHACAGPDRIARDVASSNRRPGPGPDCVAVAGRFESVLICVASRD
ncbi:hypothetical protein P2P98_14840, partial [Microbacterium sp. Kw_RZR3]|uniref:hypothetical protein n=1 Tax=Microbacterium sp. Kw_RZR3 TaxID=3032903 RepID=UPI0023DB7A6B